MGFPKGIHNLSKHDKHQNGDQEQKRGERLLPQVIEKFAAEDPDYVIGMNARITNNPAPSIEFDRLSTSQLANAVDHMSYWLENVIHELQSPSSKPIGFFGLQDFRYLVMEAAAMKIGRPLLLPSPRNALVNTVALLENTGCETLFYSGVLGTQKELLQESSPSLKVIEVPSLVQMATSKTKHYPYTKTWEEAKKDVVLIVHTSGSTGAPKPIYINQSALRRLDMERMIPEVEGRTLASTNLCKPGKPLLCGTNFYHLSGIAFSLTAIFNRFTCVFGPADAVPDGKVICNIIKSMRFNGIVMVPSLLDYTFSRHGEEMKPHLDELEHINWLGGNSPPLLSNKTSLTLV
jgi:acyl-CoA synthetase (AMP-forming)/AMP-acid ligase II